MSTFVKAKIQKLLDIHKPGTVCLASWLVSQGISHDLQKRYRSSGWLSSIGKGAFIRPNEEVGWTGGLYAVQVQANLPVHAGALTALSMTGMSHYIRSGEQQTVFLFAPPKTTFPAWFRNHDWGEKLFPVSTTVLPEEIALIDHEEKTFTIRISPPERAILECLHLAPDTIDLIECYQIMEGLTTLRPKLLQLLLEQCSSIKVKRLFSYIASKAGHDWNSRLDKSKFELGKGDRTITKGGVYVSEFGLTLPQELVAL